MNGPIQWVDAINVAMITRKNFNPCLPVTWTNGANTIQTVPLLERVAL